MELPLISVVITCYNHGRYLAEAIDSVLVQDYKNAEIIVVDDGSTDNTKEVTAKYSFVRYVYQTNKGLSAARNTGVTHSKGSFLLFLDADDWLLPGALSTNYQFLAEHTNAAFVSGAFKIVKAGEQEIIMQTEVKANHYRRLLEFNYISMHATVLYRRSVFDEFKYDVSLKACEDYDIYLKIARKYPVIHHTEFIAIYRFHESNMSYNTIMMMNAALETIKRQQSHLLTEAERESFNKGIKDCKLFYSKVIYRKYFIAGQKNNPNRKAEMHVLWTNNKSLYFRFYLKKLFYVAQGMFKG